jgi:glycine/D-amino acid oxidase-like deaminating enzyme
MRLLICGGGVIGTSIAYQASRRGARVTVIERTGLACAASGKSGGFLALDWCDGTALAPLARRSFRLHAELVADSKRDWGYRRLVTYGGFASEHGGRETRQGGRDLAWLSDNVAARRRLGTQETTAQVDPAAFTLAMMDVAQEHGARLLMGEVTGIVRGRDGRAAGVEVDGTSVAADAVVIAMGPWSILAARWLPLPGVFGLKGHSIVFETGSSVPAEALFVEYQEAHGALLAPEVFPRPDGTTYVCGVSSERPLPLDPAAVEPDAGALERLQKLCSHMSPALASAPVLRRQACYRPVAEDGLPLLGPVPGVAGAYVATAHSVWGILNAPATGEAMAELILEGAARQVDLRPFDPRRLAPVEGAAPLSRTSS